MCKCYPYILLIIYLTMGLAHADVRDYPEKEFSKMEKLAFVIKNHAITQTLIQLQNQIDQNLNQTELQNMRTKYKEYLSTHKDSDWVEVMQKNDEAVFYFYLNALKNVPGVHLQKNYEQQMKVKAKQDLISYLFGNSNTENISFTNVPEARNFKTNYRTIEFEYQNKIYEISPNLLGDTLNFSHYVSDKENTYWDKCRKSNDFQRSHNCKDYLSLQTVNLRVGSQNYKIQAHQFRVIEKSDYHPLDKSSGDVLFSKNHKTLGAFDAAELATPDYTNSVSSGMKVDYNYTASQEKRIEVINSITIPFSSRPEYGITKSDR